MVVSTSTPNIPEQPPHFRLMELPTELHLNIASFLTYPDALALKHTCRHFYSLVYTGVHLKVDWLVERFERKLECPMEKCSFRTDEAFCNRRIRKIMERRRRHLECPRFRGGCLVIEGRTCQMDLVPIWLKRQGRMKALKKVGNEVLIHGLIVLCMQLLWTICQRYGSLATVSSTIDS
ncbi:hypothetical protein BJX63DRAFT_379726 [Aspergillus granulosus]|uniref:F-box domain-containing protein n=1 Tax=Aspergillus granulosus TaxID=176169 RepID=A0ABR4HYN3_9EURO